MSDLSNSISDRTEQYVRNFSRVLVRTIRRWYRCRRDVGRCATTFLGFFLQRKHIVETVRITRSDFNTIEHDVQELTLHSNFMSKLFVHRTCLGQRLKQCQNHERFVRCTKNFRENSHCVGIAEMFQNLRILTIHNLLDEPEILRNEVRISLSTHDGLNRT